MKSLAKQKNKNGALIAIVTVLLVVAVAGVTYAWLTVTREGTKVNVIKTGTLELTIENEENRIFIDGDKAQPMTSEEGLALTPYTFKLNNTGDIDVNYTIYLDDVNEYTPKDGVGTEQVQNRMSDNFIRYSLNYTESSTTGLLNTTGTHPNRKLFTGSIKSKETKDFKLNLWIDENATNEVMGKIFAGKIRVEAIQSKSGIGTTNDNPVKAPGEA